MPRRVWLFWLVLLLPLFAGACGKMKESNPMDPSWKKLTSQEERVIVGKCTEAPFSGKFWDHHADGTYTCKRCGAPLFSSAAKFDSGTGWPSFDQALPGAIGEIPDPDGIRTEIVCANCGAHLGHIFRGEGFTPADARFCVNSVSIDFAAKNPETAATADGMATAYFAGGCFWGVEYHFETVPGVMRAESGYMGGHVDSPTYRQVCAGDTGHAETVRVIYDPKRVGYETLARLFFESHDPTQVDRQGPDRGKQYRSVVFVNNDEERRIVEKLIGLLTAKGYRVATKIEPAGTFWPAEDYHQDYYEKKGGEPYCHVREKRFDD